MRLFETTSKTVPYFWDNDSETNLHVIHVFYQGLERYKTRFRSLKEAYLAALRHVQDLNPTELQVHSDFDCSGQACSANNKRIHWSFDGTSFIFTFISTTAYDY